MSKVSNIKLVRLQILRDQIMAPKSAPKVNVEAPAVQRKRVKTAESAPEPEVVPTDAADETGVAKKKRKMKSQDKPADEPADAESLCAPDAEPEEVSQSAEAADAETLMDTDHHVQIHEPTTAIVEVLADMKVVAAGTDDDSDDDHFRRSSSLPSRPEQCGAWYSLRDLKAWSQRTNCGRVPDKACFLSFVVNRFQLIKL
jgi:hypothetical protein